MANRITKAFSPGGKLHILNLSLNTLADLGWLVASVLLLCWVLFRSPLFFGPQAPDPTNRPACTCAGTRHANSKLYVYPCECCPAAGCTPTPDRDLDKVMKQERKEARQQYDEQAKQRSGYPTQEE